MPAPVTLAFAIRVLRLNREGATVGEIARTLGQDEAAVMEAHRMLGVGVAGETLDVRPMPTAEARAAMLDKLPKRMQDRSGKE